MTYKEFKNEFKMTNKDVCVRFGIPYQTVYAWDRGKRTPSSWVIDCLARLMRGY